ncbi:hypothetical protein V2G26_016577 [Clonostachys chloroleuca]
MVRVVVAGGTGSVSKDIIHEIVEHGKHEIIVWTRSHLLAHRDLRSSMRPTARPRRRSSRTREGYVCAHAKLEVVQFAIKRRKKNRAVPRSGTSVVRSSQGTENWYRCNSIERPFTGNN